jgi:hypothetical protein
MGFVNSSGNGADEDLRTRRGTRFGQVYLNVNGREVPEAVVTVTGTDRGAPPSCGTTTVHDDGAGQFVAATWPPKRATICPSELKKLTPERVICWPDAPLDGLSSETTGAVPVRAGLGTVVAE